MSPVSYELEFITPLFSKGMYEDLPEVRPPSIRGQLHAWFRTLGYTYADEKAIFGGVTGDPIASKVVLRVSGVTGRTDRRDTLPHKHGRGNEASPKMCYLPGTRFTLHVLPRLGGLESRQQQQLDATLEAWLLMGALGLRTTRGAGSFIWRPASDTLAPQPPQSFADYEQRCQTLLASAHARFALLGQEYSSAESARRDCSDTIGGRDDRRSQDSLTAIRDPLGCIRPQRKTSPLRFRVVGLEGKFRIAALWDTRVEVTHNALSDLQGAIQGLITKDKPIGHQLAASSLAR
ncbi:CRISPR type III-B/RAMP module RAMP protein Cmr1 [Prosthecobacter debontii]|uniref:CRISPR type III-B/RAMP module RAMP protein Cmr1 n=1 Tax=Prosthecobacter debontii TaxID=48467 RepID=A0A1T4YIP6_9BACT|nr:RAMP superfamily CRISPR-associated protein [Prosthecobacter debontii]SKB01662.1 CRISPR type III-B/RAMP module RAMP protein Cmr1 [Prosthecobacter debontii]